MSSSSKWTSSCETTRLATKSCDSCNTCPVPPFVTFLRQLRPTYNGAATRQAELASLEGVEVFPLRNALQGVAEDESYSGFHHVGVETFGRQSRDARSLDNRSSRVDASGVRSEAGRGQSSPTSEAYPDLMDDSPTISTPSHFPLSHPLSQAVHSGIADLHAEVAVPGSLPHENHEQNINDRGESSSGLP